jgi:tetratricopeptide (TPR) repeat protein
MSASPSTPPPLPDAPLFLDVPTLLASSEPAGRTPWFWYGLGAMGLLVMLAGLGADQDEVVRDTMDGVALVALGGLMVATLVLTRATVRRHRMAAGAVAAAEELMQLRRWEQAAILVQHSLSRPAVSGRHRTQALGLLASLLVRYGRFDEAISVCNELLEQEGPGGVDDMSGLGLRMLRSLAMLREDHLVDADRAINDLRRRFRPRRSDEDEAPVDPPAALALVEIYRDVKTGHPREAIELANRRLPAMRRQLGHRVADVYALLARAHDLVGETAEAAAAYATATLLAPAVELHRRYPEVAKLAGRYGVAAAPKEAL